MIQTKTVLRQIKHLAFLLLPIAFASCKEQNEAEKSDRIKPDQSTISKMQFNLNDFKANAVTEIDKNIRSIFQDKNGNYWFGTNASGVYCYDGISLIQFTEKDGLSNNQVQSIQEDKFGNIWFSTGGFGVSQFDGRIFTGFTKNKNLQVKNGSGSDWKISPKDLWFYAGGGVFRYDINSLVYLPLDKPDFSLTGPQSSPYELSRYAVYSILKDKKGKLWFGTQAQGVCCFDGEKFTWFTEKGLSGSAVLALFEDSKGNIWFGNNGSGIFRYDGITLINFTEEIGLSNKAFKVSGKSGPGTLARIYAINEDNTGNLWIGTIDAGVWKYDANNLSNYTTKEGLTSNAINFIYKDTKGELWFGTDEDGICKFNGKSFVEFEIK